MKTKGRPGRSLLLLAVALVILGAPLEARRKEREKKGTGESEYHQKLAGLETRSGLLDLFPDPEKGLLWVGLPAPAENGVVGEYLYLEGLRTGLGSNPIGLDRGQMRGSRLVRIRRIGKRVLFELPNLRYRALTEDEAERQAVEESFATSVLWAVDVAAEAPDGGLLVDLTGFLLRDDHGVTRTLAATDQGTYDLDEKRSAVDLDACLAFPDNIELEVLLTYAGTKPGPHVRSTAPDAQAITLVSHHSLVRLPDDGYRPRAFDPRAAFGSVSFSDYASPLGGPLRVDWIRRHRLEKVDPSLAVSAAKEPIVYYVDPGAPEPIRSALIEGASWWTEAFAKAGFADGFRVELLPAGAHPLDVRYNVIEWVHRSTRGWSYGNSIGDPRTGEILKGHVSLGSLRVRQDIRIFEGLLGADATGSGEPGDPIELALARIRQLAAHEVGHTLGLTHNFAASVNGRASVMDYPAPLVRLGADGELDTSKAYGVGVGAWDEHQIQWGYGEHPTGVDEEAAQARLVNKWIDAGLLFLADADARPAAAAQPVANLWDNGIDPVATLEEIMGIRRLALDRFGERNIAIGSPLSLLEETLAPIYFFHRFQVDAVAKAVGGYDYGYTLRGDGQPGATPIPASEQRRALAALLATLAPGELDLSEAVLEVLVPRPFGYWPNRELFQGDTAPIFDSLGAAASAADLTLGAVLQPARLARLVDLHRRDPAQLGGDEALGTVVEAVFPESRADDQRLAEIEGVVQAVAVQRLVALAADEQVPLRVRSRVEAALGGVEARLARSDFAQDALLAREIDRFLTRREWTPVGLPPAPERPPGSPIGSDHGCGRSIR